jgi:hypothetical protein
MRVVREINGKKESRSDDLNRSPGVSLEGTPEAEPGVPSEYQIIPEAENLLEAINKIDGDSSMSSKMLNYNANRK